MNRTEAIKLLKAVRYSVWSEVTCTFYPGFKLTPKEIDTAIKTYCNDNIPTYDKSVAYRAPQAHIWLFKTISLVLSYIKLKLSKEV